MSPVCRVARQTMLRTSYAGRIIRGPLLGLGDDEPPFGLDKVGSRSGGQRDMPCRVRRGVDYTRLPHVERIRINTPMYMCIYPLVCEHASVYVHMCILNSSRVERSIRVVNKQQYEVRIYK